MRDALIKDYYLGDGLPIKCQYCKSTDIRADIKDTITSIISEQEYVCNCCGQVLAYWAYGYFDPGYQKDLLDIFIPEDMFKIID